MTRLTDLLNPGASLPPRNRDHWELSWQSFSTEVLKNVTPIATVMVTVVITAVVVVEVAKSLTK